MSSFHPSHIDPTLRAMPSPLSSPATQSGRFQTDIGEGAQSRRPSPTIRAPKRNAPTPTPRMSGNNRSNMEDASASDGAEDDDEMDDEARAEAKRRKVQRACDMCRRKKIKCDAWDKGKNGQCTNCDEANLRCAYVEAAKRRGPPPGYIETLEWKLQRLEGLASHLSPDLDLSREVGPPIQRETFDLASWKKQTLALGLDVDRAIVSGTGTGRNKNGSKASGEKKGRGWENDSSVKLEPSANARSGGQPHTQIEHSDDPTVFAARAMTGIFNPDGTLSTGVMSSQQVVNTIGGEGRGGGGGAHDEPVGRGSRPGPGDEEEVKNLDLTMQFSDVSLEGYRYHGKSSGVQLLRTVMDYKYAEENAEPSKQQERYLHTLVNSRRPHAWSLPIWEANVANGAVNSIDLENWPAPDLAQTLLDAYFESDNTMIPLLNRKIFQADYDSRRYRIDHSWAKVCLLVFANAARLVDDPRVYWYANDPKKHRESMDNMDVYRQSAGWRWLEMSIRAGKNILAPAALEDLQMHVLVSSFLMRSAVLHVVYAIAGNGLRAAQDLGVHTRVSASRIQNRAQAELHNRAFWCLIWLDRICCAGMGRTISLRDEDFDVEYPLAVDDEYWDTGDPAMDFIQPANVPSRMAYFVSVLKLLRVVERVLKKVYCVSGGDRDRDSGPDMQKQLVAELDSDLYSWLDGVPECLRWDPQRSDPILFQQSCLLYSIYYFTQILIHRPFIPRPKSENQQPLLGGFPSLAICTNAARSCSHVIEAHNQRCPPNITMMLPAFTSAVVLLIGVWGGQRAGGLGEVSAALADVRKCLHSMKLAEVHWRAAGRMRDIVTELANLSETSLSTPSPGASAATPPLKRQFAESSASRVSSGLASPALDSEPGTERRIRNLPRSAGPIVPTPVVSAARTELDSVNEYQNVLPDSLGEQSVPGQPWFMQRTGNTPGYGGESLPDQTPSFSTFGGPVPVRTNMVPGSDILNGAPGPPAFPGPMSPNGIERLLNGQMPQSYDQGGNNMNTFGSLGMQMSNSRDQWQPAPAQPMMDLGENMAYGGNNMPNQALFDVGGMSWPYGVTGPPANATQSGGVMADIWSGAPGTFEVDAWISYLQQAGPMGGDQGYQQNMF